VRGGRRRQDEELRLAEPALLHTELGAFAECAAIRLLADEADPARLELGRDALEMTAVEVRLAEIAGPRRRARRRIRDADALLQELELLRRVVQARREPCRVQEPPEVVARIREMRLRRRRHTAGIDPAEDDAQPGREDVRYRATQLRR